MTSNRSIDVIGVIYSAQVDTRSKSPRPTTEQRQSDQRPVYHRFGRSHRLARRNEAALKPKDLVGERNDAAVGVGVWCCRANALRGLDFASARLSTKVMNAEAMDRLTHRHTVNEQRVVIILLRHV